MSHYRQYLNDPDAKIKLNASGKVIGGKAWALMGWGKNPVRVNADQTRLFVQTWFEPDDLVTFGIIPKDPSHNALWTSDIASDLAQVDNRTLEMHQDGLGGLNGLYVVVNPVKEPAQLFPSADGGAKSSRGGKDNVAAVRGLFLDLDIKPGGFDSQDQAINFLNRLEVKPTMIVKNGEGGIHAWFRCDGATQDDLKAFHAYAQSKTEVAIDRLINLDRVLRLPGGIRYSATGSAGLTEIIGGTGQKVSISEIRRLSSIPYAKIRSRNLEIRSKHRKATEGDMGIAWKMYWHGKSWSDIMIPAGWTYRGQDDEGRTIWQRPGGGSKKSATTGYEDNPDSAMSLFSGSEDTGLADLKEADIALTKAVVAAQLLAGNDPAVMQEILSGYSQERSV